MTIFSEKQSEKQFVRLEGWSAVGVTGPDAAKFLQGFCTNDVVRLAEGESCEAFFTEVKGRVLAFGWVTRLANRCVVLLSSEEAPALAAHLDRYLLSAAAEVAPIGSDTSYFFLSSPLFLSRPLVQEKGSSLPVPAYGAEATVVMGDADLTTRLLEENWQAITLADFERTRLRLGVPRDRADVDDRNFPQEVDRNATAISFNKGCYLGQEPVARIDAMGQVNWLLRGLRFDSSEEISVGTELKIEGKVVGRVTSLAMTDEGAIGLGYVRRERASAGTQLLTEASAVEIVDFS